MITFPISLTVTPLTVTSSTPGCSKSSLSTKLKKNNFSLLYFSLFISTSEIFETSKKKKSDQV